MRVTFQVPWHGPDGVLYANPSQIKRDAPLTVDVPDHLRPHLPSSARIAGERVAVGEMPERAEALQQQAAIRSAEVAILEAGYRAGHERRKVAAIVREKLTILRA